MRDIFGDYQRQLFLMDHAGLPLKTVLEQLDILGGEVVPVLRKELAQNRPADVPGRARPTRRSSPRSTATSAPQAKVPNANRGDNLTGGSPYRETAVAAGSVLRRRRHPEGSLR